MRRATHAVRTAAFLSVLLIAAACESTPSPEGNYALTFVDGQPLPGLVSATVNCDELLSSGELQILSGQYLLSLDVLQDCSRAGGDTSTRFLVGSGGVRESRGTLVFTDSVGGGQLTGRQVGDDVELDYSDNGLVPAPHTLRFVHADAIQRSVPTGPR